jgi:hypothetical protein
MRTTAPLPAKKKKKKLKPAERRVRLRDRIWPGAEKLIWHRLENDGYITIPKLLSLICALLKELADNDPTRVYLDLWCRSYDEGIIERIDEHQAAFSSGYVGTRARRTWTEHIHQLEDLGFIKVAPDGNSQIGHVLMLNPLYVVDELRKKGTNTKKTVSDEWWHAYIARASEIGAFLPSDEEDEVNE